MSSEHTVLLCQQSVATPVVVAMKRQHGAVHPFSVWHHIVVFEGTGLLRDLIALFILARQHALAVAYIEIVTSPAVNPYRLQVERVVAIN